MPTIKDVAKEANVSIATVSLVLNNHARISPETNARVKKAIKKLKYTPSRSARGLVSQKSGNIGFILTEDHFLKSEPFYTNIFLGAEFEAHKYEYYILLTTISSTYKQGQKLPRFILEKNVDAVIFAGSVPLQIIKEVRKFGIPIAFIDYYTQENCSSILIDNLNGGKMAARHLINKNHKNIGFIGGDLKHPSIKERFEGFKSAIDEAGYKFSNNNCCIDEENTTRQSGYDAARKLIKLNKNITAIFACNDAMAIGAMQYLKANNIKIPDDISIIGFDDVESGLMTDPPLTTIRVPKVELGIEAIKLINDMLHNNSKNTRKILVPVELVERKTTKEIL